MSRLKAITQALLSPPDKSFLRLWSKSLRTEIYRNIQTFAFQVFRESSSWPSRNGKFVKWLRFLVVLGSIFFTMLRGSKFVKWVNCIVKWIIFSTSFLPENLRVKDKLHIWSFESFILGILGANFVLLVLFQDVSAGVILKFFVVANIFTQLRPPPP